MVLRVSRGDTRARRFVRASEYHVLVAEGPMHSIKFKRNGVEFEMSGSADDVAKAWAALHPTVVASFEHAASRTPRRENTSESASTTDNGGDGARRRTTRKRGPSTGERATSSNLPMLLAAQVDDFPEIGETPTALYAAYATLKWARDK